MPVDLKKTVPDELEKPLPVPAAMVNVDTVTLDAVAESAELPPVKVYSASVAE